MQRLRIGNSECFTFFDSEANAHLIDGNLAKTKNLQRISENKSALGLIGGGSIFSEFGNFRFNLISEKDAISYEIRAIGIKRITSEFREYDLEETVKEFISSTNDL